MLKDEHPFWPDATVVTSRTPDGLAFLPHTRLVYPYSRMVIHATPSASFVLFGDTCPGSSKARTAFSTLQPAFNSCPKLLLCTGAASKSFPLRNTLKRGFRLHL